MARTERYHKIRAILGATRRLRLQELMTRFEVSRATVFRDIAFLRDRLGVPLEYDRDTGEWRLLEHQDLAELPGLWLTATEIHALLSMQQLLENIDAGGLLRDHLQPLRQRLLGMLGTGSHSAEEIARRIRILAAAPRACTVAGFETIADALLTRQRLKIHYHARTTAEDSMREVSPQRLVHYRDNWYLDAWCHTRRALRSFAVERIASAKPLAKPASEIDDAKLDRQLTTGYGIFAGSEVHWATLRFSTHRARWVASERWHPRQESCWLPDGRYQLRLPYSADPELIMDILKYGPDCEVVEPADLRQRVREALAAAMKNYS